MIGSLGLIPGYEFFCGIRQKTKLTGKSSDCLKANRMLYVLFGSDTQLETVRRKEKGRRCVCGKQVFESDVSRRTMSADIALRTDRD